VVASLRIAGRPAAAAPAELAVLPAVLTGAPARGVWGLVEASLAGSGLLAHATYNKPPQTQQLRALSAFLTQQTTMRMQ
jgi:hypothetical protein